MSDTSETVKMARAYLAGGIIGETVHKVLDRFAKAIIELDGDPDAAVRERDEAHGHTRAAEAHVTRMRHERDQARAERAAETKRAEASEFEVKRLEGFVSGYKQTIAGIRSERDRVYGALRKTEDDLQGMVKRAEAAEQANVVLKRDFNAAMTDRSDLRKKLDTTLRLERELRSDLHVSEDELKMAIDRFKVAEAEKERWQVSAVALQGEVKTLTERLNASRAHEFEQVLSGVCVERDAAVKRAEAAEFQAQAWHNGSLESQRRRAEVEQKLDEAMTMVAKQNEDLRRVIADRTKLVATISAAERTAEDLRSLCRTSETAKADVIKRAEAAMTRKDGEIDVAHAATRVVEARELVAVKRAEAAEAQVREIRGTIEKIIYPLVTVTGEPKAKDLDWTQKCADADSIMRGLRACNHPVSVVEMAKGWFADGKPLDSIRAAVEYAVRNNWVYEYRVTYTNADKSPETKYALTHEGIAVFRSEK